MNTTPIWRNLINKINERSQPYITWHFSSQMFRTGKSIQQKGRLMVLKRWLKAKTGLDCLTFLKTTSADLAWQSQPSEGSLPLWKVVTYCPVLLWWREHVLGHLSLYWHWWHLAPNRTTVKFRGQSRTCKHHTVHESLSKWPLVPEHRTTERDTTQSSVKSVSMECLYCVHS